jgi:hypothetical protein
VWWDNPLVKVIDETSIDEKLRPGALTGLVQPGQRYKVDKPAPNEIRFRLMVVKESPKARLARKNGRTVLVTNRRLTNEDVQNALAEFP